MSLGPFYIGVRCDAKARGPIICAFAEHQAQRGKSGILANLGLSSRRMMKETGPVKTEIPIEEVIHAKVQEADAAVRDELKGILEEYKEVFLDKLPYGPPPKRIVDHEIEMAPGEAPPHKSPYRLSVAELDKLKC